MHGGARGSGAPVGNSNAFLHGEYSREFVEMRRKHAAFLRMLPLTLVDWS
jgi:hypothetical protein